jgi:hypothetical protein
LPVVGAELGKLAKRPHHRGKFDTMRLSTTLLFFSIALVAAARARGHDADEPTRDSGNTANVVVVKTSGDKRIIEANGIPDHQPGQFPNRGNPNSISAQHYRFEMPLKPHANDEPRAIDRYIFGVAINGVVFDPGSAEVWRPSDPIVSRPGPNTRRGPGDRSGHIWNYDAMGKMNLGIDENHAHVQPTGAYHYHGLPTGLIARLQKEKTGNRMLLIGYAADGFPIYAKSGHEKAEDASSPVKKRKSSYHLKKGNRPKGDNGPGGKYDGTFVQDYEFEKASGDLDECNGRKGVTPEFADGTYYYVVTDAYPFIPRYFRGTPDRSFEKHLGPPPGDGPARRGGRRGPPAFPGEGPPPLRSE